MTIAPYLASNGEGNTGRSMSWGERLAIRAPRLAVLRLHLVLTWAVMSSMAAWIAAPMILGTTQHLGDPLIYMQSWFLLSSVVSLFWCYSQWHFRSSLPRHEALGVWWSPCTAVLVVALAHSSVLVSGAAANRHISLRRDRVTVLRDIKCIESSFPKLKMIPDLQMSLLMTSAMLDLPSVRTSREARRCPADRDLLAIYAPKESLDSLQRCVENAPRAQECVEEYASDFDIAERSKYCDELIYRSCRVTAVANLATRNVSIIRRSHIGEHSFVEELNANNAVVFWMLVEGFFASCASIVPFVVSGLSLVGLWMLGSSIFGFADIFVAALGLNWVQLEVGWHIVAWPGYIVCKRSPPRLPDLGLHTGACLLACMLPQSA
jgi:hypothetical protein